jgi:Na+/H+ antiporter NhaC
VASIAIISSWIGVEIGYIGDQYQALGIEGDAYIVFLKTIPFRFYPMLMLFFGFLIAISRRDTGPMLRAERRALLQGKLIADGAKPAASFEDPSIAPDQDKPRRWVNALVPVLTVIVVIAVGMYVDGRATVLGSGLEPTFRNVFSKADSYKALLWAAMVGSLVAIGMALAQRILSVREAMEAWLVGVKAMVLAMIILVLAWSLGAVCKDLHTAEFIIQAIGGWLSPALLPALVFLVSGVVSFSTGTSWGTMGILFPLVVPLAHGLAPGDETIMLGTISSILAGSVWGDHCSPISDTTIMSSMASSCDHIDHVRTQLPYALLVGLVGLVVGDLACGLGLWNEWVALAIGAGLLAGYVFLLGKRVDVPPARKST